MEERLILAAFIIFCAVIFVAGIWLERRRAATAHKRWLERLGKTPLLDDYEKVVRKHQAFLDRVKKP